MALKVGVVGMGLLATGMRAVMQKTTLQISLRCAMLSKSPRIGLRKDTVLELIIASKTCWRIASSLIKTWILSIAQLWLLCRWADRGQ